MTLSSSLLTRVSLGSDLAAVGEQGNELCAESKRVGPWDVQIHLLVIARSVTAAASTSAWLTPIRTSA